MGVGKGAEKFLQPASVQETDSETQALLQTGRICTLFFYKNKIYKNTQAEICLKFKPNKLRTITSLKFSSGTFKKFI